MFKELSAFSSEGEETFFLKLKRARHAAFYTSFLFPFSHGVAGALGDGWLVDRRLLRIGPIK
jgi:hypothetical protein